MKSCFYNFLLLYLHFQYFYLNLFIIFKLIIIWRKNADKIIISLIILFEICNFYINTQLNVSLKNEKFKYVKIKLNFIINNFRNAITG